MSSLLARRRCFATLRRVRLEPSSCDRGFESGWCGERCHVEHVGLPRWWRDGFGYAEIFYANVVIDAADRCQRDTSDYYEYAGRPTKLGHVLGFPLIVASILDW